MNAAPHSSIFFNVDFPTYLYGIIAGIVVLVVVFVAMVGVLVCYNHKVNKVVMKVSTNIMQIAMRTEMLILSLHTTGSLVDDLKSHAATN